MYDVNLLVGVLTPLPYSGAVALYMFRWSSGSIHVPCISFVNLDSFWCKQDTTTRCLFWKKVRFADVFLRVHSLFIGHFDLEIYLHSTTYIPPPPSHTTHSVGMSKQSNENLMYQ